MSVRIPPIIGWPGAVLGDPSKDYEKGPLDLAKTGTGEMYRHILRTMPHCYLEPCEARTTGGQELFQIQNKYGDWVEWLKTACGVEAFDRPIPRPNSVCMMYQNLSPLSETYNSEYSDSSILSSFESGAASQAMQEVMQFSGKTMDEIMSDSKNPMVKAFKEKQEEMKAQGGIMGMAAGMATKADQKIDFPMMWRSSGFEASYELSIRLYNPNANDDDSYGRWIVGPLAAILSFVLPRSEDLGTYKWPFLCKFFVPGQVRMDAGAVTNVSVVKGGDQNDIAWNFRPNLIDVRLTIRSLYSTMLMAKNDPPGDSPTIAKEVEELMLKRNTEKIGNQNAENVIPPKTAPADLSTPPDRAVPAATADAASAISSYT